MTTTPETPVPTTADLFALAAKLVDAASTLKLDVYVASVYPSASRTYRRVQVQLGHHLPSSAALAVLNLLATRDGVTFAEPTVTHARRERDDREPVVSWKVEFDGGGFDVELYGSVLADDAPYLGLAL